MSERRGTAVTMSANESPKAVRNANVVLAGGAMVCLAAAGYVVYRYGFTSFYYLIPILMSLLLFASLWLRPTVKIGLTLILFSVGISLYVAELVLVAMHRSWDRNS